MGAFSDNLNIVAERLLSTYGELITVTRDVIGGFDPTTGTVQDLPDTSYTGYGYPSTYDANQIDGEIIQESDIRLLFKSSTVPLVNDVFTLDNTDYTALAVRKLRAQGDNIYFIIQLRQ